MSGVINGVTGLLRPNQSLAAAAAAAAAVAAVVLVLDGAAFDNTGTTPCVCLLCILLG